jgi:bifunctional enzyme CysN/CysC
VDALRARGTADARGPAPGSPARADQFEATIAWFGAAPLLPGRDYLLALGAATATATITPLKHR